MKRVGCLLALLLIAALMGAPALAQDFFVYPKEGQSQEQTEQDKFQCYNWAKNQSGLDPMQVPQATSAPPQKQAKGGGAVKGGVGGALLGTGIGAITGGGKGARRGAAIGGLSGAAIGGVRSSQQRQRDEQARKQWEQEQVATYTQQRNAYNRAYAACLEARGYSVK